MFYQFCSLTNPGRIRGNNEDAVAYDPSVGLGVLADGMGGYSAGEVASSMATDFVVSELARWLTQARHQASPSDIRRAIELCIANASQTVFKAAQANERYAGMGTTLVVGVFQDSLLLLGHIGDSRCYRLRSGDLVQITKDHSLLQEQLDAGLITPEQAARSGHRNLLTRALGVDSTTQPDLGEHEVMPGDLYLMCSDGLSDMVNDAEIANILNRPSALEQRAQSLIHAANARGGRDNITVLLVKVEAAPENKGLISRWLGNR